MRRLSLGEIHDQPWCPRAVRNAVTDFLQYAANHWGQYTPLLPTLCYFLQRVNAPRIVDLCSGGSGPWQRLHGTIGRAFGKDFRIVLTDRYPNLSAFRLASELSEGVVDYRKEPLDALAVPEELSGFRTLFGSFHHFDPAAAKAVLQSAVDSGQGIGIFEMTERRTRTILAMLTAPIFVLMHAPKIRPFSWARLILTYLLPIVPFLVMLDGIISCLRTYTPEELAKLTGSLKGQPYEWEIKRLTVATSPFPITYAIGCPKLGTGGDNP